MVKITQFRPFLFNTDINGVISPPFDAISQKQEKQLKSRKYNITHLTLPDTASIEEAMDTFASWKSQGILKRTDDPIIAIIDQSYVRNGQEKRLTGLMALVNIFPDDGHVKPHERIFPGPVEERVRIMGLLSAQLEPIYLAVESHGIEKLLRSMISSIDPDLNFTDHAGVGNRIYFIHDSGSVEKIANELMDKDAIVADGHHRLAATRKLAQSTAGYARSFWSNIMAYIVPLSSDGLMVAGIHRYVRSGRSFSDIVHEPGMEMTVSNMEKPDADAPLNVYDGKWYGLEPKNCYCLKHPEDCLSPVHMLNGILFRDTLHFQEQDFRDRIRYTHDVEEAVFQVDEGNADFSVIMPEWDRDKLFSLIESYGVLPQKSTYFYPKISSGIALNCMDTPQG